MGWGETAQCKWSSFAVCEGKAVTRVASALQTSSPAHKDLNANQTGRETEKGQTTTSFTLRTAELLLFWDRRRLSWTATVWPKKAPYGKREVFGVFVVLLRREILKLSASTMAAAPVYLAGGGSKTEDPICPRMKSELYTSHSFSSLPSGFGNQVSCRPVGPELGK